MRLNLYIYILFLLFWAVLLVSQFNHDRYILPANFCVILFKENQNYQLLKSMPEKYHFYNTDGSVILLYSDHGTFVPLLQNYTL